jgi:hypothetical protein
MVCLFTHDEIDVLLLDASSSVFGLCDLDGLVEEAVAVGFL